MTATTLSVNIDDHLIMPVLLFALLTVAIAVLIVSVVAARQRAARVQQVSAREAKSIEEMLSEYSIQDVEETPDYDRFCKAWCELSSYIEVDPTLLRLDDTIGVLCRPVVLGWGDTALDEVCDLIRAHGFDTRDLRSSTTMREIMRMCLSQ